MIVKIKKGDILPFGEYELTDRSKLERAKKQLGLGASNREILIAYDKIAGRIVGPDRNVIEPQSLWIIETKRKIVKRLVKEKELKINSEYGKFIIQTNEVQWLLGLQILSRSLNPKDELKNDLEKLTLGALINTFRICAHASEEKVIKLLIGYNKARNALAHKMFTDEKLTPRECVSATRKGDQIIRYLKKSMRKGLQQLTVKSTDRINEFPEKFNKLVKMVKSLELKIQKLERFIKPLPRPLSKT